VDERDDFGIRRKCAEWVVCYLLVYRGSAAHHVVRLQGKRMANQTFRTEMTKAWSFPASLFVLLPCLATLFSAPSGPRALVELLLSVATLLAPAFLVGFALAPWAGRQVRTTKAPAFTMAVAAAIASAVVIGVFSLSFAIAAIVAFFALPTSFIGALLFIGACERAGSLSPSAQSGIQSGQRRSKD
jgi:cation transport ATPase